MSKYRCENCDELVEITPNGADPAVTNRRQRIVIHPDKKRPGKLCPRGGADV